MKAEAFDIEALKASCAELGVEYEEIRPGEPSRNTMRELLAKISLRALRRVSRYVADSDDSQLNADFDVLLEVFSRSLPRAWNDEDSEIQVDLLARHARAHKKCPYTAPQYDAVLAKLGPNAKQESVAHELGVDRKTLRKWGRPQD